jgi:CheY-like chemotaxis protein
MITHTESLHCIPSKHALRKVVVVSKHPHYHMLETVVDAEDYDVVFVESTAHAYSRVKHALPNLVIICLAEDDLDGCRVMSMLKLDSATSRIPVVMCAIASEMDGPKAVLPIQAGTHAIGRMH